MTSPWAAIPWPATSPICSPGSRAPISSTRPDARCPGSRRSWICSSGYYIARGKQAYHFVSEHARARAAAPAPPYRRLAERFEHYAGALDYARRVHFFDHPEHPFFRLSLG